MTKAWQFVNLSGEILREDDASSIDSDWSFMQHDLELVIPNRSRSACLSLADSDCESQLNGVESCLTASSEAIHLPHQQQKQQLEDDDDSGCWNLKKSDLNTINRVAGRTAKIRHSNMFADKRKNQHKHDQLLFHHANNSSSSSQPPRGAYVTHNSQKINNRSRFLKDRQRIKCFHRGALIDRGFQRAQIS